MKVVTWNVNSVRVRLDDLLAFLEAERPDVVCLQELKCETQHFPSLMIQSAGYHSAVFGQPGYNGVAILSRDKPTQIREGLDGDVPGATPQARAISAMIEGVEILNLYVPNGGKVGGPRYPYKLAWYDLLAETLETRYFDDEPLIVLGDFNVAPLDSDTHDYELWKDSVLCHPDVRQKFEALREWGLVDVVRMVNAQVPLFTWWDYRANAYQENAGLRIDHVLATLPFAESAHAARVATEMRESEKPSDHAPVIVEFAT